MRTVRLWLAVATIIVGVIIVAAVALDQLRDDVPDVNLEDRDPQIVDMLQKIDESEIYRTVHDLQNFTSRHYGQPGNVEASAYLFERLSTIPGLVVEYQGGDLRNVIATLPGANSSSVVMVGAHFDSVNDDDIHYAPGATDNGGGAAIVLELARVMSQYEFKSTLMLCFWNAEDGGAEVRGSNAYADHAAASGLNISLYYNFDSSCYDPDGRYVLDIVHDDRSRWVSDLMAENNALYDIGFRLNYNQHSDCWSDHKAFWEHEYVAVTTHSESHGPAHSSEDTVDKVSTTYAKKNAQLGMSVIACLAGMA